MAFNDDFTNAGASQQLEARTGWTRVDGSAGDAYVGASGTVLSLNPVAESAYLCTDQGSADHYTEAVWGSNGSSFVCIRETDQNNFIGFRNNGSAWQVYKRVAGTFTQLGSDYAVAGSGGDVAKLDASGNTLIFTLNGTQRCLGAGVTETAHNSVTRQGVVARDVNATWIRDFTASGAAAASGGGPLTGGLTRSTLTRGRLVA